MLLYKLLLLVLLHISAVLSKKAFLDVTSFIDLIVTGDVIQKTTLSFRTCTPGGTLLTQGDSTRRADFTITSQGTLKLHIRNGIDSYNYETKRIVADNFWYHLTLATESNSVSLTLKRGETTDLSYLVASSDQNSWIISTRLNGVVKLGTGYKGCVESTVESPFDVASSIQTQQNVDMDQCPLDESGSQCDPCVNKPCLNNGECTTISGGTYSCKCPARSIDLSRQQGKTAVFVTGFRGANCEENIDECQYENFCMNGGACSNPQDSPLVFYRCLCPQTPEPPLWRFTSGQNCENYMDNCHLPSFTPCVHGTCKPAQYNISCDCEAGWKGDRCEINIDECEDQPCMYGGKCIDGIANYTCECVEGTKGRNCSINIDDCEPNPCTHGQCIDKINDFECNCTDTGFKGDKCEINIDDCLTKPCQNGGQCLDKVKDYQCDCHKAYTGKDCQTDIVDCLPNPCNNGTCYEKSHLSNYGKGYPGFPEVFNHSTAEGKVCVCNPGYEGSLCEIDINECDATPCVRGQCTDGPNMFTCTCPDGWTGKTCDVDVNECNLGDPCHHGGQCKNLPGTYTCECQSNTTPLYGGQHCTTILTGCVGHDCLNQGLCLPSYDEPTDKHSFTCLCPRDFAGPKCKEKNTMTFDGAAFLEFNSNSLSKLSFDFKSSMVKTILAMSQNADATEYVILEVMNSRFTMKFKDRTMSNPKSLLVGAGVMNDGEWRNIHLDIKPNNVNVTVEKCGVNDCSGVQLIGQAMTLTLIRVAKFANSETLSQTKQDYHGCMRELRVNDVQKVPKDIATTENRVQIGCQRTESCTGTHPHVRSDFCNGFGCTDMWTSFRCACKRPFYGDKCEKSYPTVTLGKDGTPSLATYDVDATKAAALETNTVISFATRYAKPDGFLFYLGTVTNPASYITAQLVGGSFLFKIRFEGHTNTHSWRPGIDVTDDVKYVTFERNGCDLKFRMASNSFNGGGGSVDYEVPDCENLDRKLNVNKLYVGSLPQQEENRKRKKRAVSSTIDTDAYATTEPYSGTLQDLKIGNMQVKLGSVAPPGSTDVLAPETNTGVVDGEVTPDLCKTESPCKNQAQCTNVVWNDFKCTCVGGWRGKTCSDIDRCNNNPCPTGASCQNSPDGFSCSREITLTGTQSLIYTPGTYSTNIVYDKISLKFRTREKANQNLFLRLDSAKPQNQRLLSIRTTATGHVSFEPPGGKAELQIDYFDGQWHEVEAYVDTSFDTILKIDGQTKRGSRAGVQYSTFTSITIGNGFKGCMKDMMYRDYILPVYDNETLKADTSSKKMVMSFTYDKYYEKYKLGCVKDDVCAHHQCQQGGTCNDVWNEYTCTCPDGFTGNRCQTNIDECVNHDCRFGLCQDGINKFTCDCYPGYTGAKCETDVNECNPNPCQLNAGCTNKINDFTCACPDKFGGKKCEIKLDAACDQTPCKAGTCTNIQRNDGNGTPFASYKCECPAGKEGIDCGSNVDYCKEQNTVCKNGGTCKNNAETQKPECDCAAGYSGPDCGIDIDECATKPCNNGVCVGGVNTFSCVCDKGWKGGRCDEDEDECQKTPNLCNQGTCNNTDGGYICDCETSGYLGVHCEHRGPCADVTCQNQGLCQYVVGTKSDYKCNCKPGWRGRHCEDDIPECTEIKPCRNGAQCVEKSPLYECECLPGYSDKNCSTNIDECAPAPCQNGGRCVDGIANYTCDCADTGYEGRNCEDNIDECLIDNICNGGNCTDMPGNFSCSCLSGWKGPTCADAVKGEEPQVNLALVIGPIVAVVILLFLIGVIVFLVMARGKRANRGVYSPSRHENSGDGLQMNGPWLKPPPQERLI